MELREIAGSLEDYLIEYTDEPAQTLKTSETAALEKQLHAKLKLWAKDHKAKYKHLHLDVLPVLPGIFPDQKIDRPGREVTKLSRYLPERTYMAMHKKVYAKAVGSVALADQIINGFKTAPAFEDEPSVSVMDYTVDKLEQNQSLALASAHLDRLSDITDLTGGLNIAIAEEHGLKYANRFKVIVNKLMAFEKLFGVPMAWLISVGMSPRWGLPEIGAAKYGMPKEAQDLVNGLLAQTLIQEQRAQGQVVGIVPAGSAAIQERNEKTNELEKLRILHSSAIASLFARYSGVIPANRWGDNFIIGNVIEVNRPKGSHKKHYSHELTDLINYKMALQASELTGLPVEFERLNVRAGAGVVAVRASAETQWIDAEPKANL